LSKLTKKRKSELLKQYPDGEAIGRAYIEFYLDNHYRVLRNKDYKPILEAEELEFLQSNLIPIEVYSAYKPFFELREALVRLHNAGILYEQSFDHALYQCIHVIQSIALEIEAIYALSDSQGENTKAYKERFLQLYSNHILMANDNFRIVYEGLLPFSLLGLYHQDYLIEKLGEIYNFDFSVMRNPMESYESNFNSLHQVNKYLLNVIIRQLQEAGDKAIVDMPHEAVTMFEGLDSMKIEDYRVKKATKIQIEKYVKIHDKFSAGFTNNIIDMFLPD